MNPTPTGTRGKGPEQRSRVRHIRSKNALGFNRVKFNGVENENRFQLNLDRVLA